MWGWATASLYSTMSVFKGQKPGGIKDQPQHVLSSGVTNPPIWIVFLGSFWGIRAFGCVLRSTDFSNMYPSTNTATQYFSLNTFRKKKQKTANEQQLEVRETAASAEKEQSEHMVSRLSQTMSPLYKVIITDDVEGQRFPKTRWWPDFPRQGRVLFKEEPAIKAPRGRLPDKAWSTVQRTSTKGKLALPRWLRELHMHTHKTPFLTLVPGAINMPRSWNWWLFITQES